MIALSPRIVFIVASCFLAIVNASIFLEDIEDLMAMTKYVISKFETQTLAGRYVAQVPLVVLEQMSFSPDAELDDEAEHEKKDIWPMLLAFSELETTLSKKLRKRNNRPDFPWENPYCDSIIASYHDHMNQTTHFLALLMKLKPLPSTSSAFISNQGEKLYLQIERMQKLWASRNGASDPSNTSYSTLFPRHSERELNKRQGLPPSNTQLQKGSFIEQRQSLYKATHCFLHGPIRELLRRDVEIVELLNDLIDQYWSECSTPHHS